jgi:hypothetical protein
LSGASSGQFAAPSVTKIMNLGWPAGAPSSSLIAALTPFVAGVPPFIVIASVSAPGIAARIFAAFIPAIGTSGAAPTTQAASL